MRLLFEASVPVRASLAEVRALIDSDWVLERLVPGNARSYVDVDRRPGTVGVQGHWWYRGEVLAVETAAGTRLVQRVFNIARRGAWAVPVSPFELLRADSRSGDRSVQLGPLQPPILRGSAIAAMRPMSPSAASTIIARTYP